MTQSYGPTERTRVRRRSQRGAYDQATIHSILDEGMTCHVGFVVAGRPVVIPTIYVRRGSAIYLHGAQTNRTLQAVASGGEVCVTVTLVDGLVLARSAFHHSMNYRSVVIFGTGRSVEESAEKNDVLHALTEHLVPGRWQDVRTPTAAELAQTLVVAIDIVEASAKIRSGPPIDDEEDYALPVWAGVVPLRLAAEAPIVDPRLPTGSEVPRYALTWQRPQPVAE